MIKVKVRRKKNPIDKEFLESVKVKKVFINNLYNYSIYYKNENIGLFLIEKNTNYILEMEIFEDKYKRRGLATFMHDYIEKDLGIKIVVSDALTAEGKYFYKSRVRKNPTDKEFLKTIFIEKDYDDLHHTVEYHVFNNSDIKRFDRFGKIPRAFAITSAYYDTEDKWVYDLYVQSQYQRKGLATFLYDYIEKDQNVKLKPSSYLLEPGKAFWAARKKRQGNDSN